MNEQSPPKQTLQEELDTKRKEIIALRTKLSSFHTQKEEKFQKLRSIQNELRSNSTQIQSLKTERDQLTGQVKEFKVLREKFHHELKEHIGEQRQAIEEKKQLKPKNNLKMEVPLTLGALQAKMRFLERKIETEVMPFHKEQELNKKIKELKLMYKQQMQARELAKNVSNLSANAAESKRKADESHQQVQEKAKSSQEKHQNLIQKYEEIKKLRESEKTLTHEYLESKNQYQQLKDSLDHLVLRVQEISKLLKNEDEVDFKTKIKEKGAQIKEKLKSGKKLRMEYILAYQAVDES